MKIAIVGYGNLGRGVEAAIKQNEDMELSAVFTRRAPEALEIATPGVPVLALDEIDDHAGMYDAVICCGGSATDLPEMTPALAEKFNVVDSFDTHANIPTHFKNVENSAKSGNTVAIISAGWDPGYFSLARVYALAALPKGDTYTFWGPGVSQGHSDAIRRIEGVLDARQYTLPVPEALEKVRAGNAGELTTREKHTRECWVVAAPDADKAEIERKIKTMPNYFADYDTTVHFISAEELKEKHSKMMHGGKVIRAGVTEGGDRHVIEYGLDLESNPCFTASILVSCARAAVKMAARGEYGCYTMPEVRPCDLLDMSIDELRAHLI